MTTQPLLGRVVVVAGEEVGLAAAADAAFRAGAQVAVVSTTLASTACTVRFRADPTDDSVWERVAMHVEQHLGPVDGVVTDGVAQPVVSRVFGPDLDRRGHGDIVVVAGDPVDVVSRLARTP